MTVQKGKEGGAGRNQSEKKMQKEGNHCSDPAPVREAYLTVRHHIYAVYPDRKPDALPRRKGRRVPWAGTDLRHDRSEEKTISKVSLLSKSITIKFSTQDGKNPAEAVYGTGGSWYNPDCKEVRQMEKKLTVIGCVLWIAGLIVAIVGLNLTGDAKTWVSVTGNIVFLVGLGITGAVWLKKRKSEKEAEEKR